MALDDYGAIIRSGMSLVPDFASSQAAQVGLQTQRLQQQLAQTQILAAQSKQARADEFKRDLTTAMHTPDATSISGLIMKYPEFADQVKSGWDVRDKAQKDADLTQLGEIYSAASGGNWELAAKAARARFEADKAAGQADATDEEMVKALESGDPAQQKAALGTIGIHIAAATGAEHFGTVYGALQGDYTLQAGDVRKNRQGDTIGHSPFIKADDGSLHDWDQVMGGASPTPAAANPTSIAPAAATVASTLATGGLPAPVVAGFMGNFHAEGGWDGAQGDGGSASGIAQWRNERAANFQKVIGKPPTEADHADQAKFVLWEMQHPEEAGMTMTQRDAIMNAKTPAQAAALIDKFYERSSGKDRSTRMSAAAAFAGLASGESQSHPASGGLKPLLPGKQREAPSGFRWSADGTTLEKIPGGPADKPSGPTIRAMTEAEKADRGLDPNLDYKLNTETGDYNAVGGQQKQAKQVPQQVVTKVQPSIDIRDTMARLAGSWRKNYGGHMVLGESLNSMQRTLGSWSGAPEGMANWWADYQSMDNLVRNQLFGSALTEHEKQAYAATTISPRMDPKEVVKRFNTRRNIINAVTTRQQKFLKTNGYDPEAVDALFDPLGSGNGTQAAPSAPIQVRSVQEAQKLTPGTLYLAPDGKVRRR